MRFLWCFVATTLVVGLPGFNSSAAETVTRNGHSFVVAEPAAWVVEGSAADGGLARSGTSQSAVTYLRADFQYHLGLAGYYNRYERSFNTGAGVQSDSQIRLSFDPGYQQLTIHHVRLVRDDAVIDQLSSARIEIIQQEPDLAAHIYNGRVTVVIFPNDIRVGDRLDYAFTLEGDNPVLSGRSVGATYLRWSVPVTLQSVRLLAPKDRAIQLKLHGGAREPIVHDHGGLLEHLWEQRNATPLDVDDALPGWYDPYDRVEWSEFPTWASVVDWALPLYNELTEPPREPPAQIEEWLAVDDPMERARLALRFVQDEIRYLGFELGPQSHRPASPATVLDRRFGDCKDKAYLLCSLLRSLGVEAYPALVNTVKRQTVSEGLPSPYAFNHVICLLVINGRNIWVDPTQSRQRGPIDRLHLPDYRQALVIRPGDASLTPVDASRFGKPIMRVTERFEVRDYSGHANLSVSTIHEGLAADQQREWVASAPEEELQKEYLNYYARSYPDISVRGPLKIKDDPANNRVEVEESYRIDDFWKPDAGGKTVKADFAAWAISEVLSKPGSVLRTMPLGIGHPVQREHEIWVDLPELWAINNDTTAISNDAFDFRFDASSRGKSIRLKYTYESKADHLPVEQTAGYIKDLDQVAENLYYYVYRQDPDAVSAGQPNAMIFFAGGLWAILMLVAAVFVYRIRPDRNAPPLLVDPKLCGIGGWLILVMFGLLFAPLALSAALAQLYQVFVPETWRALTTPGSVAYNPWWAPVLLFELVANISLLIFVLLSLVLFFQKRSTFPKVYVVVQLAAVVILIVDNIALSTLPIAAGESGTGVAGIPVKAGVSLVWVAYMLKSRRVKATFVR